MLLTVSSMMYSKLFSSIVQSSLWSQPDHIRLLFITLLALADRDGIVYGSRSGLERVAFIDLDAADEINPWTALMNPDSDSSDLMRNPENEGKRIEEIPGGFRIINYAYYRSLRDSEDRRRQNAEAQERFRNKHKPRSAKVSPRKPRSAIVSRGKPIESEIEIEKKKKAAKESQPASISVEDWLKELEADETYHGISVRVEYGKMLNWCKVHGKEATRRRFVNWINRSDKPLPAQQKQSAPFYPKLPPKREVSDQELSDARDIARREMESLRQKLQQ